MIYSIPIVERPTSTEAEAPAGYPRGARRGGEMHRSAVELSAAAGTVNRGSTPAGPNRHASWLDWRKFDPRTNTCKRDQIRRQHFSAPNYAKPTASNREGSSGVTWIWIMASHGDSSCKSSLSIDTYFSPESPHERGHGPAPVHPQTPTARRQT